ncbi:MAG: proprotein convertase P-domain-containing protein [Ignavibacteria bacterium]|nr:proprotein convertase P-domain-containing protein [Ignavibacteria bacterium]
MKTRNHYSFSKKFLKYLLFLLFTVQNLSYSQYASNYAAEFNGGNSYVSYKSNSELNPNTAITVEAWVYPTALPTSMAVIGKNYLTGYYFGIESTGRFIFFPRGAGFFLRSRVNGTVQLNKWAHIAATYDGSVTRLYLNGLLDTTTTSITGLAGSNTDSLFIGADRQSGSPAYFFSGLLDNVRIWKSARTLAEISSHRFIPMNMPAPRAGYSSLSASYQFDNNVIDHSGSTQEYGNERNISYVNYSNKSLNYLDYNNSLVLNGTTDYARRGSYNSVYDPTVTLTLEAWIKRDTTGTQPVTQNIVNKSGGSIRYAYALFINSSGNLIFAINSAANAINTPALITTSQWTHVAATYNKNNGQAILYINGENIISSVFAGFPTISADNDSTFIGGIGATSYAAGKFKGQIDEVRIWYKSVRTQQQIRDYMHKHYKASAPDSLMHVDFDEFQNSFKLGDFYFPGSLLFGGNTTISSSHNNNANVLSSPMINDLPDEVLSTYTSGTGKFFIPDANSAGITDSIYIAGGPPVSDLKIFTMISHSYTQDLRLTLTSPSGTTINLMIAKGGSNNDIMTIFSDDADSNSASGFSSLNGPGITSPFSPKIKPDQPLSAFNGQSRKGWWKLKCVDIAGADIGFVHKWGLNLLSQKTLNLTALIQGFYDETSDNMTGDTVQVTLRIPLPPYPKIDSAKAVLDSAGNANFYFSKVNNGYKVFKHRNSIETWSAVPVPFTDDSTSFDFSSDSSETFGNNVIRIDNSPVRFAIYNGDVNQDGTIDLTDGSLIDNDIQNFESGYLPTDVNGDDIIDLADAVITDNNSFNFVGKITP